VPHDRLRDEHVHLGDLYVAARRSAISGASYGTIVALPRERASSALATWRRGLRPVRLQRRLAAGADLVDGDARRKQHDARVGQLDRSLRAAWIASPGAAASSITATAR